MNGLRVLSLLCGAFAGLAIVGPAWAQQQSGEPRVPTELWEEYPLDPTATEERAQEPAPPPAEAEPVPTTATVPTITEPASVQESQEPAPAPGESDEGASIALVLLVVAGIATAAGVVLGVLLALWRRRPPVRRALRSEAGSLALLPERPPATDARVDGSRPAPPPAEEPQSTAGKSPAPAEEPSRRVKPVLVDVARPDDERPPKEIAPAGAPPADKPIPGVAPPEGKRPLRSAPPPGKSLQPEAGPPEKERTGDADPLDERRLA